MSKIELRYLNPILSDAGQESRMQIEVLKKSDFLRLFGFFSSRVDEMWLL
jgi:hypothetical protein